MSCIVNLFLDALESTLFTRSPLDWMNKDTYAQSIS